MDRRYRKKRAAAMVASLVALVLLTACTEEGTEELASAEESAAEPAPEPDTAVEEEAADEVVPAVTGSTEFVQDLWVYERFEVIGADGEVRDHFDDLLDHLDAAVSDTVELPRGATFLLAEDVAAGVSDPDGTPREDVTALAGILTFDDARAPAVLATPHDGAATIGLQDRVTIDLTPIDDLEVGDLVVFDLAFLQAFPIQDTDLLAREAGLDPLALFIHRLEQEQVSYFGREDPETGAPVALTYTAKTGRIVEGSRRGELPAKSSDMTDGMQDGLDGCNFGLRCVKQWFEEFGGGALDSFGNALCNAGLGMGCPPDDPPNPTVPFCLDPPCGNSRGEPHIATFDGVNYSFQAVGEFVLTSGDDLEVQARFQPWRGRDDISAAEAIAVRADGVRLTVQLEDGAAVLRIDGAPVDWTEVGDELEERGIRASLTPGTLLQLTTSAGHRVSVPVRLSNDLLDVYIDLAEADGAREGLLGNADGDGDNDFVAADGDVLAAPPPTEERYGVFADSWRVTDATSLFDYRDGEDTETFTDRDFPAGGGADADLLDREDPAAVARARALCERLGISDERLLDECTLDVALTGEPGLAASALTAERSRRVAAGELALDRVAPWLTGSGGADPGAEAEGLATDEVIEVTWRESLLFYVEESGLTEGDRLTLRCPPAPANARFRVFGTDVYWTSSNVCASAVHAGVADVISGGTFVIEFRESVDHFEVEVEDRNGIDPEQWRRRGSGYVFADEAP